MKEFNGQPETQDLRALAEAEIEPVSGAKGQILYNGLFGTLWSDGECVAWTISTEDGQGGWTLTTVGQC